MKASAEAVPRVSISRKRLAPPLSTPLANASITGTEIGPYDRESGTKPLRIDRGCGGRPPGLLIRNHVLVAPERRRCISPPRDRRGGTCGCGFRQVSEAASRAARPVARTRLRAVGGLGGAVRQGNALARRARRARLVA